MRSSITVDVAAPARLVFELAHDIERWPRFLPHYHEVRVLERHGDGSLTTRMLATRTVVRRLGYGIPVAWRARTSNDPQQLRLTFQHLGGATKGMDVTWRIEEAGAGCTVTIEHDFAPRMPGWASLVDRLFVRPIAGRTLATFKDLAEATNAAIPPPPRSRRSAAAKEAT